MHQLLLVTNFEDGLMYTLRGVSSPTGTVVGVPYGPFDQSPYNKADEGTAGFADKDFAASKGTPHCCRRLWGTGVQVQNGNARVYFSVWSEDMYRHSRGTPNEIWSAALTASGPTGLPREESTNNLVIPVFGSGANSPGYSPSGVGVPSVPTGDWSSPIAGLQFSTKGDMLIAERTMWSFANASGGDYGSLPYAQAAHNSRVLEFAYIQALDRWSGGPKGQYYVGGGFNVNSSNGGADYGYDDYPGSCEQRIWMTGDFLKNNATEAKQPSFYDGIYGLASTKAGVGFYSSPSPSTTNFFVDINNKFNSTVDKVTPGDVVVYRDPCSSTFIEVCKQSSTTSPVTGSFTFTATNIVAPPDLTFFTSDPLMVPVGYCTGPIPVPAGPVVVTETPTPDVGVRAITASTGSSQNVLVSTDVTNATAKLMVAPVAEPNTSETVLNFTNEQTGQLKICKIAGPNVPPSMPFKFMVVLPDMTVVTYSVPAGPASEGGYCVVDGTFPVGTSVSVAEVPIAGYTATSITVNVNGTPIVTPPIVSGGVMVTIGPGFTEVAFTNSASSPPCPQCTITAEFEITNYSLVSQQSAAGTLSYSTYRADLSNTGAALGSVTATLLTSLDASTVQAPLGQSSLHFVVVPANGQVTSSNTFTILTDPAVPVDFSKLRWTFRFGGRRPPRR